MEPVGLAVGVLGLAGLFSSCLDVVERFDSWRSFADESRLLGALFEGERLRLKRWGSAVGLDNGELSSNHHEALDDPRIISMVCTYLSIIKSLCGDGDGDGEFPPLAGTSDRHAKRTLFLQGRAQAHANAPPESRRQKTNWALREKAKCKAQVEAIGSLVQSLCDLVPADGAKGTQPAQRKAGNDAIGYMDGALPGRDPWAVKLERILATMEKEFEAAARKDVHAWLLGRDTPNELYDDAIQKRVDGTCDWILKRRSFLDWASSNFQAGSAKILWVNGARGFGKTILCARVVEHLCSTLDVRPAHFFFSSDFESRRDPFVAVRSWLCQLLSHPTVFELAQNDWNANYGQIATRADIIRVFRKVVLAVPRLTFVLDGLDECTGVGQTWDAGDATSVAKFLEKIQQAVADTNTRMLIVSRDEPEIRQSIIRNSSVTWVTCRISPEDNQSDTVLYARSIVDRKLHNKDETIKNDISLRLANRCSGQFLWVKMQEPSLRSGKNKKQLEAAIDTSPAGLDQLYDRDWQRLLGLSKDESARAISLLRWAAFALRPLTVAEITEALLIDEERNDFPIDEMPDSIDEDYVDGEVLGLCGSLVEVWKAASDSDVGSRTVHLAHFSVKEFFISRMSSEASILVASARLRNSDEATQNNILAKMCLRYVSFRSVWQKPCDEPKQPMRSFLDYAAGSWYKHAAMSKRNDSDMIRLTNAFFNDGNAQWRSWGMWYDLNMSKSERGEVASEPKAASALYYASLLCLAETVRFLITEQRCNINETASSGATALAASCSTGDAEIVAMLLEAGADITIARYGRTPLHAASAYGHVEAVRLLLKNGADIKIANSEGWTALHTASRNGHIAVVKLLLENRADIAITNNYGWTPLHAASIGGHAEVAKLLIESQADIKIVNSNGWTPLYAASVGGHAEVVKLLLENGEDIKIANSDGPDGWTPLHAASAGGHAEVVKLLVENGADIKIANSDGWTPLHAASRNGHIAVVKLLLENRADIAITDYYRWTPLHVASDSGHAEVVKLLIEKGADIKIANSDGWTPLYVASRNGHIAVVKLLLENRADITFTNYYGWTPLYVASNSGHTEVVKLLIKNGADIKIANSNGWTPLHAASACGHIEAVRLLLKNGADIKIANSNGWTPLHAASGNGHIKAVQLLLEVGADIAITDYYGWTPLHAAAQTGQIETVRLLLEKRANAKDLDANRRTALFLACAKGHMEVVEHLSLHGVAVNTTDRYDATPLFAAARNGHDKIVAHLVAMDCDIGGFRDGFGRTLLWWASKSGNAEVIKAVLQFTKRRGIQVCDSDLTAAPRSSAAIESTRWCDVCIRHFLEGDAGYKCTLCQNGDFDLCEECFAMGAKCLDDSHTLVLRQPTVS